VHRLSVKIGYEDFLENACFFAAIGLKDLLNERNGTPPWQIKPVLDCAKAKMNHISNLVF